MVGTPSQAASAIRHCLLYLLRDAVEAGLPMSALHIRLAIAELEAEGGTEPGFEPTLLDLDDDASPH